MVLAAIIHHCKSISCYSPKSKIADEETTNACWSSPPNYPTYLTLPLIPSLVLLGYSHPQAKYICFNCTILVTICRLVPGVDSRWLAPSIISMFGIQRLDLELPFICPWTREVSFGLLFVSAMANETNMALTWTPIPERSLLKKMKKGSQHITRRQVI